MASISDLAAAVSANTDAINAAIAFISSNPPADPAVVQSLIDQLKASDAALTNALAPRA